MVEIFSIRNFFWLFFLGSSAIVSGQEDERQNSVDPDLLLSLDHLLEKHGYPVQTHEVTTEDGYILTIFRVPHGKNGSGVNPKPILMMHGLYGTAYNFVFTEYFNMSMAGYFADRGYDVWLANTRGTTYGRKHVELDPKKSKFWKFSWHEIGLFDLPATVDYILNETGRGSLFYTGHSQGGTIFYVLTSLYPEYQKKFAQASLMAPGGLMGHFNNSLILPLARSHRMFYKLAESMNLYELPPPWLNLNVLLFKFCIGTVFQNICEAIFSSANGKSGEVDLRLFPMMINSVTSASTMQALHYAQNIEAGKFRPWDFGAKENLKVYGQENPPDYPVENIEVPVAIYYGKSDNMAFAGDQEDMCRRLRNCTKHMMRNPKWNHIDFLLSKNLEKELFEPLMGLMETYSIS